MKKIVSLMIVLSMILVPLAAIAAPGDATILRRGLDDFESSVESIAYLDGTLYMLTYDGLYTYADGDEKAVRHEWDEESFVPQEDEASVDRRTILTDGESVYIVCHETLWTGEDNDELEVLGVTLRRISIEADGSASAEVAVEFDPDGMVIEESNYAYVREMRHPFVVDGMLYFQSYSDNGQVLMAYDLEDGTGDEVDFALEDSESYVESIVPYKDGKLLCIASKWTEEKSTSTVMTFDLESEEMEELFVVPTTGHAYPGSFVYSEARDSLYYVMNGELYAIEGMDPSTNQSVADMPADSYSESLPIITEDGLFISGSYDTVVRRNTDPSLRAETRLVVQNWYSQSIESAYYAYTNAHPDVEVVMTNQIEDIVQAMMNRSSAVDVYCLSVASAEYDAMFTRGYMAELTGSEAISGIIDGIYPSLREFCVKDGEVVALPVEVYTNARGYNMKAFEKVGLTEDDVPKTWIEYLEMLEPMAEYLEDYPDVSLFEPYYTKDMFKSELFWRMLEEYMTYIAQPGNEFKFDTPMFRALMDAYEAVDFDALGLLEEQEERYSYEYTEDGILFNSYADISPRVYILEESSRPLMLALSDEVEPLISANMSVVFVNPFSENREMAVEFVERIAANLEEMLQIQMMPERNEPLPNKHYESNLADYDELIEAAKAELEKADEDDKPTYEERVAEYEEYRREYVERGMWDASAESIAQYRTYAERMLAVPYVGIGNDNAQELYTLIQQLTGGLIRGDAFIKAIDGKLQMMILEGQ